MTRILKEQIAESDISLENMQEVAKTLIDIITKYQLESKMQTGQPVAPLSGEKVNVTLADVEIQSQNSVDNINLDVMDLDNENCVEEIVESTPSTKHSWQPGPLETDFNQKQEAKLVQLEKKKSKAKRKAKIKCLGCEKTKDFVSKRLTHNEDYTYCLALKRSKRVCKLNVYKSALQCELMTFLAQVDNAFCQKPIMYSTEENKVLYAVNYIADTIWLEWCKEDEEITFAFNRPYSYKKLCKFL